MDNYAFIDSQNLYLGVTKSIIDARTGRILQRGWQLDYAKFRKYLADKLLVKKAFLFIGFIKENEKLYATLRKKGYILIFKEVLASRQANGEITYKGNVDAELVLHTMIEYGHYDKAVIVSNDGDFLCLIQYLVRNNKLLKIICANDKYSKLLKRFSNYIITLSKLQASLEYLKKKSAKISDRTNP